MKVVIRSDGQWRVVGTAEVPDPDQPEYIARLFANESIFEERFFILTVPESSSPDLMPSERVILVLAGQLVELLPNWCPRI